MDVEDGIGGCGIFIGEVDNIFGQTKRRKRTRFGIEAWDGERKYVVLS